MTLQVLAIGDVGVHGAFHLGDEAMLEAALVEIGRRREVHWTVISARPDESSARYGVPSISRIGFAALGTQREREARLDQVLRAARGEVTLTRDDPALAVLDAVTAADAVLIAGGGNLSSGWPEHIYERAALAGIALALATRLVVSGQSLGPQLTGRDGELVSATLTGAQLVGVRERASAGLAEHLGVPAELIWCAVDDAAFIDDEPLPGLLADLDLGGADFVACTFSAFAGAYTGDEVLPQLAALLEGIVEHTGLDVVLIPHLGSLEEQTHDCDYHAQLIEASKSGRVKAAPLLSSGQGAWLTRQAAMVVSSRYHPVVFATTAGIPTVGISVDDYTENKIRGALELVGMESWCVSLLGLGSGVVATAVEEAWRRRAAIADHLAASGRAQAIVKSRYWDAVSQALTRTPIDPGGTHSGDDLVVPGSAIAHGDWTVRNDDALSWNRSFGTRSGDWQRERADWQEQVQALGGELEREQVERCIAVDEASSLVEALVVERAGSHAARLANAELLNGVVAVSTEYAALQRTKLVRWARPARAVYGSMLRRRS